jgi:hypothetical protein
VIFAHDVFGDVERGDWFVNLYLVLEANLPVTRLAICLVARVTGALPQFKLVCYELIVASS